MDAKQFLRLNISAFGNWNDELQAAFDVYQSRTTCNVDVWSERTKLKYFVTWIILRAGLCRSLCKIVVNLWDTIQPLSFKDIWIVYEYFPEFPRRLVLGFRYVYFWSEFGSYNLLYACRICKRPQFRSKSKYYCPKHGRDRHCPNHRDNSCLKNDTFCIGRSIECNDSKY